MFIRENCKNWNDSKGSCDKIKNEEENNIKKDNFKTLETLYFSKIR